MTTKNATTGFLAKAFAGTALALAIAGPAVADPIVQPGFGLTPYYAHDSADHIISYDWDASEHLFYLTTTPSFSGVDLWQAGSGAPANRYHSDSNFAGASVVTMGDYVYFNDSNFTTQFVRTYGPLSGTPGVAQISTTPNYGLYGHNGSLFLTGSPNFGTNQIYHSDLDANGHLVSNPAVSLGVTSGSSGPLTWDGAGNLYYAPGFSDLSIYKWSAQEVAEAIGNPSGSPLSVTGHRWLDYSGIYGTVAGATSMLVGEDGALWVTFTSFSDPSVLAKFGVAPSGQSDGTSTTVLTDTGIVGELRAHDGGLYVSADNQVYQVVPEPMSLALVLAGSAFLASRRRRS